MLGSITFGPVSANYPPPGYVGDWPYSPWDISPYNPTPYNPADIYKHFDSLVKPIISPPIHNETIIDDKTRKIEIKVAGFKQEEISVAIDNHNIEVKAEKEKETGAGSSFYQRIQVSIPIHRNENIKSADIEDGILTLILVGTDSKPKGVKVNKK